jgi:hypothetical protein
MYSGKESTAKMIAPDTVTGTWSSAPGETLVADRCDRVIPIHLESDAPEASYLATHTSGEEHGARLFGQQRAPISSPIPPCTRMPEYS